MKSGWLILFIPIVYVSILFGRLTDGKTAPFEWDRLGYYSYLPAVFIYNDLGTLSFYPDIIKKYELAGYEYWYATYPQENGKRLNKYAIGTCLFQLPFFIAAHTYVRTAHHYPADGFSLPYQYAVAFSTVFWVAIGLAFLRRFLLRYFNDSVAFLTLFCIAMGTNLFDYSVISIGMSHPYSFCLFASLLYYTDSLYRSGNERHMYILAFILGLITVIRPVNIVVILIPAFWKINNRSSLRTRIGFFRKQGLQSLAISAILFLAIIGIQASYWKYITGHWVYFSYKGEGFSFLEPEIWKGLFSWRKGWFVYTPLAFVSFLGFFSLWKKDRAFVPSFAVFFAIIIYIVFSWWNWYYGGTFGCRPLIETLALLSLPLAALIDNIGSSKTTVKIAGYSILIFFISLNLFQTYQHSKNIIHYDRMTATYYWKVFGKTQRDPSLDHYLMDETEYMNEIQERSKE